MCRHFPKDNNAEEEVDGQFGSVRFRPRPLEVNYCFWG